ncbi:TRAP transporter substrate-binding protein DctP [Salipiger sp.]|uniref:TRAP transporter substrate-binding protein n=1 Tax=Salipiger sp. TaxID=2078585 RepID=UPI003A96F06A
MNLFKSLIAGAVLLAGTTAQSHAADLRLGDFQSTTHIVSVNGTQWWMDHVKEATGGEVSFTHFPAEQGAKAKALLEAVANGILDVALIQPIYHSEKLPLWSVVGLPGFYETALQGTRALQQMTREGPTREELLASGVVPIFAVALPPYQVLSKAHRMGDPSDWTNMNIRTSGAAQALIAQSLGGVGVSMPGPEVYTGVERGRLDAVLFPLPSVPGYNLQEVSKHISTNGSFGGSLLMLVMNKDVFENLPADTQAKLLEVGDAAAVNVSEVQDDQGAKLAEEWAAQGVDVYTFTDAELEKINGAMSAVSQDWLDRIGAHNDDALPTLERYRALAAK